MGREPYELSEFAVSESELDDDELLSSTDATADEGPEGCG